MKRARALRAAALLLLGALFLAGGLAALVLRGPIVVSPPGPEPTPAVSVERLRETVRALTVDFHPRSYLHPGNLDRAAAWIADRFREAGLDVEEQEYRNAAGTYRNVIARREGLDPDGRVLVLGAHYDTCGDFPGADDNASGVAVLLELARMLPPGPPSRPQIFAAFSTEEPPFFATREMGSYRLALQLAREANGVDLMVALDLVGYFRDEPGSQRFPLPGLGLIYPRRGDFIAVVGDLRAGRWIRRVKRGMRATGAIPVVSFRAPSALPGVHWSDHFWFRRLGLPGVLVTDTAFLRNPHYHLPSDTAETLDYHRMAAVVRALHGVLREYERGSNQL